MHGVKSENPVLANSTITIALTAEERDAYIQMAKALHKKKSALGREIIVAALARFNIAHEQPDVRISITEAN